MSAREKLIYFLKQTAAAEHADMIVNDYAHELAEKQRHEHNEVGGGCELGVCHGDSLPDLIDPEVTA